MGSNRITHGGCNGFPTTPSSALACDVNPTCQGRGKSEAKPIVSLLLRRNYIIYSLYLQGSFLTTSIPTGLALTPNRSEWIANSNFTRTVPYAHDKSYRIIHPYGEVR